MLVQVSNWWRLSMVVLLLSGINLFAQKTPPMLSSAEIKTAVDTLASMMERNYVFPEKGKAVADLLHANEQKGVYLQLKQPNQLAEQLSADLFRLTHDKHLSVYYDPEKIQRIKSDIQDSTDTDYKAEKIDAERQNYGFKEVKILPGDIGYIKFDGFFNYHEAFDVAAGAMAMVSHTKALIFDVRDNGGGYSEMIQFLCSYLVNAPVLLNTFYYRPTDEYSQSYTQSHVPGEKYLNKPVYVLTSNRTFSAAEEFTYDLQGLKIATIIGEVTGGGAHPVDEFVISNQFLAQIAIGKAINPITKTNWEGIGVKPDIEVTRDNAVNMALFKAYENLSATEKDPEFASQIRWAKDELQSKLNPITLTTAQMKSYTGQYGVRNISLVNNELYYQRENRPAYKMTLMSEDVFRFDDIPYFRLRFIRENGKITEIEAIYGDGRREKNSKTK